jgi:hypothetical protein
LLKVGEEDRWEMETGARCSGQRIQVKRRCRASISTLDLHF